MVCDIIISIMYKKQPGQYFVTPERREEAEQTIDSYVYDSNLSVNEEGVRVFNERHDTELNLEEASREAYQGYERYMYISGGKLALHKCKFVWLRPTREIFKYVFSKKARKKFMFRESFTTRRVQLLQLKAHQPHKILGMRVNPSLK